MLALIFRHKLIWQKSILVITIVFIWITGTPWVPTAAVRLLEWRYLPPENLPNVEVIVVLGGGTQPNLYPRQIPELNSAGDRLLYTAWLYHQGKADHILLSGGRIDWLNPGETGAEDMVKILEIMGVPDEALWIEKDSLNTYDNAVNCRKILEDKGIHRVILVTSALHMPRSVALFKHQGIEVIPAPTDYSVTQADWQQLTAANLPAQLMNLIPSAGNMETLTNAMKEVIGIFIYHLRGWL